MIPCYRPVLDASDLVAGHWPVGGREEFEAGFAGHVGAKHALAVAHARLGFFMSLKALELRDAEIILPAYTCANMAEAIVASGNRPVFVDINPHDYSMDLQALAAAMTPQTRVVVVTHMFGFYSDPAKVREVVGSAGVTLVEDCAQRLSGRSDTQTGFSGDLALYSFGASKPLCTILGGLVATHSADLHDRIQTIRDREFGNGSLRWSARAWLWWLASYAVYSRGVYRYWQRWQGAPKESSGEASSLAPEVYQSGNGRYADFQGRIGCNQLKRTDSLLAKRRLLAELYHRELEPVGEVIRPALSANATQTYYTVRIPRRDECRVERRMWEEGVVVGRTYDYVVPDLEPFRRFAQTAYPNSRQAASEVVNLPVHPWMREEDVLTVVGALKRVLGSR